MFLACKCVGLCFGMGFDFKFNAIFMIYNFCIYIYIYSYGVQCVHLEVNQLFLFIARERVHDSRGPRDDATLRVSIC